MNSWRESELEDYLASNSEGLRQAMFAHSAYRDDKKLEYLGRQIRCNAGIIDLLFHSWLTLYVVELKAVKATSKDLGQVLRYSQYVSDNLHSLVSLPYPTRLNGAIYRFIDESCVQVESVIIAPSFDASATTMLGVKTLLATQTANEFEIKVHGDYTPSFDDQGLHRALAPFAAVVQQECLNKLESDAERSIELSAQIGRAHV